MKSYEKGREINEGPISSGEKSENRKMKITQILMLINDDRKSESCE